MKTLILYLTPSDLDSDNRFSIELTKELFLFENKNKVKCFLNHVNFNNVVSNSTIWNQYFLLDIDQITSHNISNKVKYLGESSDTTITYYVKIVDNHFFYRREDETDFKSSNLIFLNSDKSYIFDQSDASNTNKKILFGTDMSLGGLDYGHDFTFDSSDYSVTSGNDGEIDVQILHSSGYKLLRSTNGIQIPDNPGETNGNAGNIRNNYALMKYKIPYHHLDGSQAAFVGFAVSDSESGETSDFNGIADLIWGFQISTKNIRLAFNQGGTNGLKSNSYRYHNFLKTFTNTNNTIIEDAHRLNSQISYNYDYIFGNIGRNINTIHDNTTNASDFGVPGYPKCLDWPFFIRTTLNGAIDTNSHTIQLTSSSNFPTRGYFKIGTDTNPEIVYFTRLSGSTTCHIFKTTDLQWSIGTKGPQYSHASGVEISNRTIRKLVAHREIMWTSVDQSNTSRIFEYTVTVVNNKFSINGVAPFKLYLIRGHQYKFHQNDYSNTGHPLRFSETSDGTHDSGTEYTTNVTTSGNPGSYDSYTTITIDSNTPKILYYYCSAHPDMGREKNSNDNVIVEGTLNIVDDEYSINNSDGSIKSTTDVTTLEIPDYYNIIEGYNKIYKVLDSQDQSSIISANRGEMIWHLSNIYEKLPNTVDSLRSRDFITPDSNGIIDISDYMVYPGYKWIKTNNSASNSGFEINTNDWTRFTDSFEHKVMLYNYTTDVETEPDMLTFYGEFMICALRKLYNQEKTVYYNNNNNDSITTNLTKYDNYLPTSVVGMTNRYVDVGANFIGSSGSRKYLYVFLRAYFASGSNSNQPIISFIHFSDYPLQPITLTNASFTQTASGTAGTNGGQITLTNLSASELHEIYAYSEKNDIDADKIEVITSNIINSTNKSNKIIIKNIPNSINKENYIGILNTNKIRKITGKIHTNGHNNIFLNNNGEILLEIKLN